MTVARGAGWAGIGVALAAAGPLLLRASLPPDLRGALLGSTDAWTLSQVELALELGSWRDAASLGLIPNPAFDPLYGLLTCWLAQHLPPIDAARHLSAAAWSLATLPLFFLGRALAGRWGGLALAACVLFPPWMACGWLLRYDSLALLLALSALATAACAPAPGLGVGALAGALVGLAFTTREYLGAAGLPVLGLLLLRAGGGLQRMGRLGGLGIGVAGALAGVGWASGIAPTSGLAGLLGYGLQRRLLSPGEVPTPTGGADLLGNLSAGLYLPQLGPLVVAGGVGLVAAALWPGRAAARASAGACLGTLALLPLFARSAQQSPQYYLVFVPMAAAGGVALVGGVGRWVTQRAPRLGWAAPALAALVWGLLLSWAPGQVAPMLRGDARQAQRWHSEAWPVDPLEIKGVCERLRQEMPTRPVVLISRTLENIDGACRVYGGWPVAFLYPEHRAQLEALLPVFAGYDVEVVQIESRWNQPPWVEVEGATRGEGIERGGVVARRWTVPAGAIPLGEGLDDPFTRPGFEHARGVHLTLWHRLGGAKAARLALEEVRARRGGGPLPVGGEMTLEQTLALLRAMARSRP